MQMKKLRLLAVRDVKEELLRELIRRGCVEISELEGEIEGTELEGLLHRESTDVSALRSKHAALVHAVELLDVYAPKKTKLLAAKPELEDRVLLDDTGLTGALKVAEAIESSDARIKRIAAEESRQRSVIESLQPWLGLDLPLDFEGTERCGVLLGTMPGRIQLADAEAAIAQVDEEAELFSVRSDKKEHDVLLVCMKGQLPAMQDALRARHGARVHPQRRAEPEGTRRGEGELHPLHRGRRRAQRRAQARRRPGEREDLAR